MPPLRIETQTPSNSWTTVGEIQPGERDGSISDVTATGRDVYIFGVDLIENLAYIKRCALGMDIATSEQRVVDTLDYEEVASLAPGESHEMTVMTDRSPEPRHLRFTHLPE